MSEITVTDVGPVRRLRLDVDERGGVYVLKGRNGCGKSETLSAIESAAGVGKRKPSPRIGADKGQVEAFGATLKVGRSVRRTGELEVQTLDGKLSIVDFVSPPIKDQDAADAHRIKAMLSLAGFSGDVSLYYPLVGGKESFRDMVGADPESSDAVAMAGSVKRLFESAAREAEAKAERKAESARVKRQQADGLDLTAETDSFRLQAELESAIADAAQHKAKCQHLTKQCVDCAATARRLQATLAEMGDVSEESATAEWNEAGKKSLSIAADVIDVERKIKEVERTLEELHQQRSDLLSQQQLADSLVAQTRERMDAAKSRAAIQAELIASDNERQSASQALDELALKTEAIDAAVAAARKAVEQGAVIYRAKQVVSESDADIEEANQQVRIAKGLRIAASKVDTVLSEQVAKITDRLWVKDGRLYTQTDDREECPFCDLSDGQRWKIGIDLAVNFIGESGLIVIPQVAWSELDPINRRGIAEHAQERGVVVLTAEATGDSEIHAERFEMAEAK